MFKGQCLERPGLCWYWEVAVRVFWLVQVHHKIMLNTTYYLNCVTFNFNYIYKVIYNIIIYQKWKLYITIDKGFHHNNICMSTHQTSLNIPYLFIHNTDQLLITHVCITDLAVPHLQVDTTEIYLMKHTVTIDADCRLKNCCKQCRFTVRECNIADYVASRPTYGIWSCYFVYRVNSIDIKYLVWGLYSMRIPHHNTWVHMIW